MAKVIKYNLVKSVNHGTEDNPEWEAVTYPVTMGWNETNEETAKKEAYNGEYTIEDDGEPEIVTATTDDILNTLLGVSE